MTMNIDEIIFYIIFSMALTTTQINGNFTNVIDFAIINTCQNNFQKMYSQCFRYPSKHLYYLESTITIETFKRIFIINATKI